MPSFLGLLSWVLNLPSFPSIFQSNICSVQTYSSYFFCYSFHKHCILFTPTGIHFLILLKWINLSNCLCTSSRFSSHISGQHTISCNSASFGVKGASSSIVSMLVLVFVDVDFGVDLGVGTGLLNEPNITFGFSHLFTFTIADVSLTSICSTYSHSIFAP